MTTPTPAAGPDAAPAMKRYTADEMHWLLIRQTSFTESAGPEQQAYRCPYYAPLRGVLSTDWGVVLNPESSRFGLLTFEHDDCGCEPGAHGQGNQRTDEWRDRKRERAEAGR